MLSFASLSIIRPLSVGEELAIPFIEQNDQTRARSEHLEALRALVGNVYPNKFERSQIVESGHEDTITSVFEKFRAFEPMAPEGGRPIAEEIELANQQLNKIAVRLAGRIASPPRVMGKAAFVHLSDGVSRLQVYVRRTDVKAVNNDTRALIEDEGKGWELFGLLDHGDFIGVEGYLFVTKTGELSVHVQQLQFLAKALLPLPDKMHGIHDPEIRQRQRYADLIAGSLKLEREEGELTPREVFERRSEVIREMRRILEDHGYIEVETPMLTPLATGAAARPFKTHHNALDIDLYARIAPELYLKRLLVGGFEKVYELNRNFRNEGIDRQHNPEFTMLEFYWAYADVNAMMDFCEQLLRVTVFKTLGSPQVKFGERCVDFSEPFLRTSMKKAIIDYWPIEVFEEILDQDDQAFKDFSWLGDVSLINQLFEYLSRVRQMAYFDLEIPPLRKEEIGEDVWKRAGYDREEAQVKRKKAKLKVRLDYFRKEWQNHKAVLSPHPSNLSETETAGQIAFIFERFAERKLVHPTFITDFPKAISPLSKASPADPTTAERFELFIAGMECANGFSELNDPEEQFQRFMEQTQQRERGDEEAMVMDEDYIRALSYGMPPAAGIGIGIDRFVMLLTNRQSIRDVILFPHLRPERKHEEPESEPPAVAGG